MITYILQRLALFISRRSDRSLDRFSLRLAQLLFMLGFRKKLLRANITKAFGQTKTPKEIDDIAIASIQSLVLTTLELIEGSVKKLGANVELKSVSYLNEAMAAGRGCFILSTHSGNWEALAAAVSQQIAPAYVPVKKVGGKAIDDFITGIRRKYGLHIEERKKKGDSYAIIKSTLGRGHIVGFMQDQARPGSPRMPFFGHPAKTNISMAAIWGKVHAPMISAVGRRLGPRQHQVEFFPLLPLRDTQSGEADILHNAALMNREVEKLILNNPKQFLWMHDRWK